MSMPPSQPPLVTVLLRRSLDNAVVRVLSINVCFILGLLLVFKNVLVYNLRGGSDIDF